VEDIVLNFLRKREVERSETGEFNIGEDRATPGSDMMCNVRRSMGDCSTGQLTISITNRSALGTKLEKSHALS